MHRDDGDAVSAAVSLPTEPYRIVGEDGCVHFSHLKQFSRSGSHYLHATNAKNEPTRAMLVSTCVHQIILGPRADKKVVVYPGDRRQGKAWDEFLAANTADDMEIVTRPEWSDAEEAARIISKNPLVIEALRDARTEVPLKWRDGDVPCSTSGVDIVGRGMLGDLKGTHTAEPEAWKRTAFRMHHWAQLVWYRRGAIANGIDVSNGLFVLGYEMSAPYPVVPLEMTDDLIDLGEKTVSLWLERFRLLRDSIPNPTCAQDWPAYVQSPMPWEVPAWKQDEEDEDE